MIETIETGSPKMVGLKLSGTMHNADYRQFEPKIESILTAAGKVRLLVQFEDFHGWDLHAAWDDFKFGLRHYSDFERIAMVGDRRWEKWMARMCKPFTRAKVRYFDRAEIEAAWNWLREEEVEPPPEETERASEWSEQFDKWPPYHMTGF
jgi:hypothetical protein